MNEAVGHGRDREAAGDLVTAATCHWIGAELAVLAGESVGNVRIHFLSAIAFTKGHLKRREIGITGQRIGRLQERLGDVLFDGGGEAELKAMSAAYYNAQRELVYAGTEATTLKQCSAIASAIARIDEKLAVVAPPRPRS